MVPRFLGAKNTAEVTQKNSSNWPMMNFIHSGSEIRIYRISSGKKLDRTASYPSLCISLFHKKLF